MADQIVEAESTTTSPAGGCGSEAPGCDGQGGCGSGGGCGGHTVQYVPLLDARTIDPVIRQSAIFGVLIGLPSQESVVVVTDQDPEPVADLLAEQLPGEYTVVTESVDEDELQGVSYRVRFIRS
ncbi:hypothetical protein KEM60_00185 [Austwickia sp. TVS 96-490-7B]|uniref:DUF2249 domain-containing protein n=1 Tax=Austwickia sp. TVS 96-490-7B TaxID=2830843 RepID=UPI001C5683AE|nr:DUF2249 domain-containing protein [Austwickia sp. TVS 96-490-7B]MBW3084002.1 hypothetical protein [Austwickia sp. TVS 96-490-7B]